MRIIVMRDEFNASRTKQKQDEPKGKTRITIMIDNDVLEDFRKRAKVEGLGYQTLINQALRSSIGSHSLNVESLRKIIREETSVARQTMG